jgi:CheY-like chemotaxis protein
MRAVTRTELLDIGMPGMDGHATCRQMRKEFGLKRNLGMAASNTR